MWRWFPIQPSMRREPPPYASGCAGWSTWKWKPPARRAICTQACTAAPPPNAIFGLIELLARAKNSRGEIKVPGVYDDVELPAPAEKESWALLPFKEKDFLKKEVGSTKLVGESKYSVLERIWARPTFEVHGIAGGFTGAGSKTVIPSRATAKVSFRLVPHQDPDKVIESFRQFVKKYS